MVFYITSQRKTTEGHGVEFGERRIFFGSSLCDLCALAWGIFKKILTRSSQGTQRNIRQEEIIHGRIKS
jgi:hypothetical protein